MCNREIRTEDDLKFSVLKEISFLWEQSNLEIFIGYSLLIVVDKKRLRLRAREEGGNREWDG